MSAHLRGARGFRLAVAAVVVLVASVLVPALPASAAPVTVTVSGTVSFGAAGQHPAGVTGEVSWEGYDGFNWKSGSTVATTDSAGRYALALAPGTYRLRFEALVPGYQGMYWSDHSAIASATQLVVGTSGRTGINQTVPTMGVISGHVYLGSEARSAAAGEVKVTYDVCYEDGCISQTPPTVLTDASGNYTFPDVYNGAYTLHFYYVGGTAFQPAPDKIATVTLAKPLVRNQNVIMPVAASISGLVVLGSTTTRAQAGEVRVIARYNPTGTADVEFSALTDANGRYVIAGLPAGLYRLRFDYVGTRGYADEWWSNAQFWQQGASFDVTTTVLTRSATLAPGGTIRGLMTNSAGTALKGISVTATTVNTVTHSRELVATVFTRSDGKYTISGLPAGSYDLSYADPNSVYSQTERGSDLRNPKNQGGIKVTPGSITGNINDTLYRGTVLSGWVSCAACPTFTDMFARLQFNTGTAAAPKWVNAGGGDVGSNGYYRLQVFVPGSYRLVFTKRNLPALRPNATGPITIREGTPATYNPTVKIQ